jgi:hypothetical protein
VEEEMAEVNPPKATATTAKKNAGKGAKAAEAEAEADAAEQIAEEAMIDVSILAREVEGLRRRDGELQVQLENLTMRLGSFWGADSISSGIAEIIGELEPLRYLVPPQTGEGLPNATVRALHRLRASLARPDWTSVTSLGISEPIVFPIGAPTGTPDGNTFGSARRNGVES